jgi:hypothetical protein
VRKFRPVPGENPVVAGRKFCSRCGRWRLLMDFCVGRYGDDLKPLYFQADCRTCCRVRLRMKRGYGARKFGRLSPQEAAARRKKRHQERRERREWLEDRREFARIYAQSKRREKGIAPRPWGKKAKRGGGKGSCGSTLDAGPFLEWLSDWRAYQDRMRAGYVDDAPRPVASLEDLAELAGCSARAFGRARETGRIQVDIVDRILVAAGGDVMLAHLYPEH